MSLCIENDICYLDNSNICVENRGFKQQLSVSVPAEKRSNQAQGKPQTCTDQRADQLKSRFLLIGTSISKKNIRKYVRKLAGTDTDSYCLNPLMI